MFRLFRDFRVHKTRNSVSQRLCVLKKQETTLSLGLNDVFLYVSCIIREIDAYKEYGLVIHAEWERVVLLSYLLERIFCRTVKFELHDVGVATSFYQ